MYIVDVVKSIYTYLSLGLSGAKQPLNIYWLLRADSQNKLERDKTTHYR